MLQPTHGNMGTRGHYWGKMGPFAIYPLKFHRLDHFHPYMSQMKPTMSFIIITHDQKFFPKNWSKFFFPRVPPLHEKVNTMNIYFYHWSSCSAIISFFHVL